MSDASARPAVAMDHDPTSWETQEDPRGALEPVSEYEIDEAGLAWAHNNNVRGYAKVPMRL